MNNRTRRNKNFSNSAQANMQREINKQLLLKNSEIESLKEEIEGLKEEIEGLSDSHSSLIRKNVELIKIQQVLIKFKNDLLKYLENSITFIKTLNNDKGIKFESNMIDKIKKNKLINAT